MKSSLEMFSWLPRLLVQRGDRVGEVLRRQAGGLGGLLHLLAVLVGAREEVHVVAEQAVPARIASPTMVV